MGLPQLRPPLRRQAELHVPSDRELDAARRKLLAGARRVLGQQRIDTTLVELALNLGIGRQRRISGEALTTQRLVAMDFVGQQRGTRRAQAHIQTREEEQEIDRTDDDEGRARIDAVE